MLIATVGDGICFLLNAASFVAVVLSLVTMDRAALSPGCAGAACARPVAGGAALVRSAPELGIPLAMMAAVGCLAYEFQVTLPYMASRALYAGPKGFGFMTAAMGVGAVVGGLFVAARGKIGAWRLVHRRDRRSAWRWPSPCSRRISRRRWTALLFVGAASIAFMSTGNATLQLNAAPRCAGA